MLQDYDPSFSRVYFSRPRLFSSPSLFSPVPTFFSPVVARSSSLSSPVRPVARCRQRFLTAGKRKLLLNREKEKLKCVKDLTFFTMEQSNKNITNADILTSERERNLAKENGETQQANINDENMQDYDDQQPFEKDIVQPKGISNAPTVKCLENVGYQFENFTLAGVRGLNLLSNFIDYILSHEMSYFQNKDPNNIYSVSVREYEEQKTSF
ncbi:uncharacterized protein TNCV_4201471 [Trichonephila clavipes]|uniref:Uncharacterized protein n=1 Tax=Trichonephila clavipes TaxID=2585209 RepID=A0A8X6WBN6_TRICX|nr:uncharacterized protein TNCV_4201471 [Trichonephila clavipes]